MAREEIAELPATRLEFKAEGFKLSSLPIDRAAKYIGALARLLGTSRSIHLLEARDGSAEFLLQAEPRALKLMRRRLIDARRPDGGKARAAFKALDDMLAEDGGHAKIFDIRTGQEVIQFPGLQARQNAAAPFWQDSELRGQLTSLRGRDDTKHGEILNLAGREGFECSMDLAREMRAHLFEQVSVSGRGQWQRSQDGNWHLLHFTATSFVALASTRLLELRSELHALGGLGLSEDPDILRKLMELR